MRKEAYEIEICTGIRCDMISGSEALDHLINETINVKNNKKAIEQGKEERAGVLTDKQKADDHLMDLFWIITGLFIISSQLSMPEQEMFMHMRL